MTTPIISAQCESCDNFRGFNAKRLAVCRAYINGIPLRILTGEHDHRKPFPGDNGIRFTPRKPPRE